MGNIRILVDWCGSNYAATAVGDELDGAILVTDRSLDRLKKKCKQTLEFHSEGVVAGGDPVPLALRGNYELEFELTAQALLRSVEDKVTLTAIHKATGIDMKQLSHYATGEKNPRPIQREKIVNGIHRIAAELAAVV